VVKFYEIDKGFPMEPIRIPRRCDDMPTFLVWEMDVVMIPTICLVIGIMTETAFTLFAVGLVTAHFFIKFKDGKPANYLAHLAYSVGFPVTNARTFINPFIKRMFP
jgi:type IV conjugative transfer system protein TraL